MGAPHSESSIVEGIDFERFIDSARELMWRNVRPSLLSRDTSASYPAELVKVAHQAGMFSAFVPKEFGGLGLSLHQICILYFELCRQSLDLPWVTSLGASCVIAPDLINQFCFYEKKKELLSEMVNSGLQFCIANSESGAGTNLALMQSELQETATGSTLNVKKDCATNASIADWFIVSAKRKSVEKYRFDIFLLPKALVHVTPIEAKLMGFRTSATGKIEFSIDNIAVESYLIGTAGSGLKQFQRCFDMERLLLAAAVSGLLQAIEDMAVGILEKKGKSFSERQYLQQKLLVIFSAKEKIWSLVERVVRADQGQFGQQLGLLKWLVITDGLDAALAFFELTGQTALFTDHFSQKIVRDFMALRFFGGTMELQKMSIFSLYQNHLEDIHKTKKAG